MRRGAADSQRLAQPLDEPLDRQLAVAQLAALVLGDRAHVGPAFATTRRFCPSVSADDASTSKTASTRVSDVFACCPPGPLEREKRSSISSRGRRTERVTRIDSRSMAAILLDVDGVLHVSGEPIPGAVEAVPPAADGHRLRFVTNNSTRARARARRRAACARVRARRRGAADDAARRRQQLGGRRVSR